MARRQHLYPFISIIFPNHNGGNEPLDCLDSIEKLEYPQNRIEVIIIDNNSHDGSPETILRKYPWVRLTLLNANTGFAKAVNLGIGQARGDFIFIGNDDLVLHPKSLKLLVKSCLNDPKIGVIGGKIFYKFAPERVSSTGYSMNFWTGNVYKTPNTCEPDWLQGCAILIPRSVFTRVGLLDSEYQLLFDDFDLALRVKRAGFVIKYLPEAIFWHGESLTVDRNKPHKYYHWYKSKFRFLLKNLPWTNICSIFFLQTFVIAPYRALVLHDGRLIPFIKGVWWNVCHLRETLLIRYAV